MSCTNITTLFYMVLFTIFKTMVQSILQKKMVQSCHMTKDFVCNLNVDKMFIIEIDLSILYCETYDLV